MSDKEKDKKKQVRSLHIDESVIERLEEIARNMGVEVRYEQMQKPGYPGGLCRIKESWVLIINRASLPLEKVELLAEAISTRDTESIYLQPDIREILEWVQSRRRKDEKGSKI